MQQEIERLRKAASDLYAALDERENCPDCHGDGTHWTLVGEEAEADPCDCSLTATLMLHRYEELTKDDDNEH